MKKHAAIIILIVCLACPALAKEISVSATVDRTAVNRGESLSLTVTINGGDGEVSVSGIRDFEVVSRGTSRQYRFVDGKASTSLDYTYRLVPLKEGRLLIPPLPVTVKGKTLYTEMIEVSVAESEDQRSGAARPDLLATITLSDTAPFVGEQIICRISFYRADGVRVANSTLARAPDFEGFSVERVEETRSFERVIDGRRFQVTELGYVLTAESAGTVEVGPAVITCDVVVRRESRGRSALDSFFDDSFFSGRQQLESRRLTAEPVTVTVKPLPTFSGPGSFSGLVGEFDISAAISDSLLARGEAATLTVIVGGRGNIKDAAIRDLDIPPAFRVYEAAPEQEIAVSEAGLSGQKRFSRALMAVRPGRYTLGPYSLTYFDPGRNAYVTAVTEPLVVTVTEAQVDDEIPGGAAFDDSGRLISGPAAEKQAVAFTGRDIFPIKDDLDAIRRQGRLPWQVFVALVGMPGFLYLAAAFIMTRLRKEEPDTAIMAGRAQAALRQARRRDADASQILDALHKALVYAVHARAGKKGESLTYREAGRMLAEKGCDDQLIRDVHEGLKEIERYRYGGEVIDADRINSLFSPVKSLVRRLGA